jgi:hypothetical protein
MTVLANAFFKALVDEIGEIEPDSPSSFSLLMEVDLPVVVRLHPNEQHIFVECELFDLAPINGPIRSVIINSLLALNYQPLGIKRFFIGLDSKDFVKVFYSCDLQQTNVEELLNLISSSTEQAIEIRKFITSLTLHSQ